MFEPISTVIKQKRRKFSFKEEIEAIDIFKIWSEIIEDIFDAEIGKACKPIAFKQGVLNVKVENSILSQELQLRRNEIKDIINKKLKRNLVEKITFQL